MVLDPTWWLLRPDGDYDAPAEARVELPAGFSISAPWHPAPSAGNEKRFGIPLTPEEWMGRVAIGRFDEKPIALAGGTLRLSIVDGVDAAQRGKLEAWITHVSRAAISAYGKLPLADVQVLMVPVPAENREPVVFGQSTRGEGHGVTLFVDATESAAAFDRDWVAVHELSHLFHPYLGDRGSWLAEGLATYYQNVLRARAELLTPAQAWEQIDAGFARGRRAMQPHEAITLERASAGTGGRHDFMRIYWSGTAYWLEADAELRRTSGNRLSIDEALRRFDACCLPSYSAWEPADFVAKLDALLGTDVFGKRFREYDARRDFPNLDPLYRDLGIKRKGDALDYDDDAPAAATTPRDHGAAQKFRVTLRRVVDRRRQPQHLCCSRLFPHRADDDETRADQHRNSADPLRNRLFFLTVADRPPTFNTSLSWLKLSLPRYPAMPSAAMMMPAITRPMRIRSAPLVVDHKAPTSLVEPEGETSGIGEGIHASETPGSFNTKSAPTSCEGV